LAADRVLSREEAIKKEARTDAPASRGGGVLHGKNPQRLAACPARQACCLTRVMRTAAW
jgi:hypothetical protein